MRRFLASACAAAFLAAAVGAQGAPVLAPGDGFDGPTPEPPAVGSGPGADARAIARFDVVPFQSFDGDLEIGVVAFHRAGIDRVELSLEGGPWTAVRAPTRNPRTGVQERWAVVRAPDLPDGPVEVRAIAYPVVGLPRVLPPLVLHANAGGSLPRIERHVSPEGSDETGDGSPEQPFRTILRAAKAVQEAGGAGVADGGRVLLSRGDHEYGAYRWPLRTTTRDTWLVVRPAPGLSAADVRLTSAHKSGLRTKLVKLEDLTIRTSVTTPTPDEDYLWLDGCALVGEGQHTSTFFVNHAAWSDHFATRCTIRDNQDGLEFGSLQRDVRLERIGSDAFGNTGLVVNCTVRGIDPGPRRGEWHPDVFDFSGGPADVKENFVVYGLRAYDLVGTQGLFADDVAAVNDVAFVNVLIEADGGKSQWKDVATDHLLLWGVTLVGQDWAWRTPNVSNLSVRGCVFEKMTWEHPLDAEAFASNHYVDATSYGAVAPGADATRGPALFRDPDGDDYRPGEGTPLRARLAPLAPVDASGAPRSDPTSAGALE